MALRDARVRAAAEFYEKFTPVATVNYAWAVKCARDEYAAADAAYKANDDKAGAILAFVGSGASLFAIGSAAAAAIDKVPVQVAASGAPALLLALSSMVCAVIARRPGAVAMPPGAIEAATAAHLYHEHPADIAEASLLGAWAMAAAVTRNVNQSKAANVRWSVRCLTAAVVALLLPFATAFALRS